MTLVYATGEPRRYEFATAASRRHVPEGATVFAVIETGRGVEFLADQTFEQMSDEEYYELQGLVNDARRDN